MTSELDRSSGSLGDKARARAYLRDFLPAMLAYCVVLIAVVLFGGLNTGSPWRVLWALLPVIPLLWVVRAVFRHLERIDEFQQRGLLRGLGTGFAVAMIVAVTTGFLGIAGLDMRFAGWMTFGAGMIGWLVAGAVASAAKH